MVRWMVKWKGWVDLQIHSMWMRVEQPSFEFGAIFGILERNICWKSLWDKRIKEGSLLQCLSSHTEIERDNRLDTFAGIVLFPSSVAAQCWYGRPIIPIAMLRFNGKYGWRSIHPFCESILVSYYWFMAIECSQRNGLFSPNWDIQTYYMRYYVLRCVIIIVAIGEGHLFIGVPLPWPPV